MNVWTNQDLATLRLMLHHGAEYSTIAKAVKRTRAAVFNKAKKLGLRLSADVVEARRIQKRREANISQRDLIEAGRQAAVAARLAWCPEWRRDEFRSLRRRLGAAEAQRIIIEDERIQAARAARRAA